LEGAQVRIDGITRVAALIDGDAGIGRRLAECRRAIGRQSDGLGRAAVAGQAVGIEVGAEAAGAGPAVNIGPGQAVGRGRVDAERVVTAAGQAGGGGAAAVRVGVEVADGGGAVLAEDAVDNRGGGGAAAGARFVAAVARVAEDVDVAAGAGA